MLGLPESTSETVRGTDKVIFSPTDRQREYPPQHQSIKQQFDSVRNVQSREAPSRREPF